MEITQEVMDLVEQQRPRIGKMLQSDYMDVDDAVQDIYERLLVTDQKDVPVAKLVELVVFSITAQHSQKERRRKELEAENQEAIIKNTTPTVSGSHTGSPEDFIDCEQTLSQRWRSLSPFLQTVAKRQFFGYEESVAKTARDLGTTVAAINMARTRIKQVLNGVKA